MLKVLTALVQHNLSLLRRTGVLASSFACEGTPFWGTILNPLRWIRKNMGTPMALFLFSLGISRSSKRVPRFLKALNVSPVPPGPLSAFLPDQLSYLRHGLLVSRLTSNALQLFFSNVIPKPGASET